jgi:hypothetical protein
MAMDRRDFLKLAGLTGLSVSMPYTARAQESLLYDGTFYVMVNAGGGWDPTSLCDPKGRIDDNQSDPMNESYYAGDIQTAGNISFAPVGYNATFFNKFSSQLLVLNGVDTQTNGHDQGSRAIWSGKLGEGNPSFSALVAAEKNRAAPLSFLSNGGYDYTAGQVAPTRSGNTNALARLAFPNRLDPNNPDSDLFHTDETAARIATASQARLASMEGAQRLPRMRRAINTLFTARVGESEVRRLTDFLPSELDQSGNQIIRQAQIALASYKAGLSVSVNLSMGGFDTHGNHDANHIPRLATLLQGVEFVMDEAERHGVADKVVVVVGSDFGRTPGYNDGNGKDHWSITSMLLMGQGISGNRVVGQTNERHALVDGEPALRPEHVHVELRELAGIASGDIATQYPVIGDNLGLFNP